MSTTQPAPLKRCSLLRRRADMSVDAFRTHWAAPHAAIARSMGGIARYTQNRVDQVLWERNEGEGAFPCDGIVELEFQDGPALAQANASPAVQRLLPEDEPRFMAAITLCNVSAGARQTWPGRTKVMLAATLGGTCSDHDMHAALAASGCLEHSMDRVLAVNHRATLAYETRPPHLFATLWFDGPTIAPDWARAIARLVERGTAWHIDPLPILG